MIKNYFFKNAIFDNFKITQSVISFFSPQERQKKIQTFSWTFLLVILGTLTSNGLFANVGITPASGGSVNSCTFPTGYVTLGNIVINEGNDADFSIPNRNQDYTLILTAPTNFEFNTGVGTITNTGNGDITSLSMVVTSSTITITYSSSDNGGSGGRTDEDDIITLSNIQFRGINTASSGNILRLGANPGSGTIAGITNGTTNFGTLTSTSPATPTVTRTSAAGTDNQSICISTLLTPITYSISGGGATGATVAGLPTGVTFLYAAGILTISGTPTASGTFNYTVSSTGGTCTGTATGSITVGTVPTITLTSAGTTTNQTLCQNTPITNITYSIGGSATGVTPSGLPAGVTGNLVGSVYTISGTPTGSGTSNYTLTTTGTGACAAATATGVINVNAAPATPVITSNSPQCNPAGVLISQTGSAPAGQTWYWQGTTSGGTSTANSAATYTAGSSGTYYIRSRNNITGCWSVEAGITVTVNNIIGTLATITSPTNGATGVCYSGTGAVTQISWAAAAGATGYDVYFGTSTPAPTLVSSNQAGTTWTISPALAASTTYYWRIVPRNSCGATIGTPINWSFTTNATACYCTPSSTSSSVYIAGVTAEGTLINGTNTPTGYSATGYGNYTAPTLATQIAGGGINIRINLSGSQLIRAFVDWNNDAIFADPAEVVYTTGGTSLAGATTFGFVVPLAQAPGNYRIRIRTKSSATVDPCIAHADGEAEDYTIAVVADCAAKITSVTDGSACGAGSTVLLTAVGNGVTTSYKWYTTATGGTAIAGATSSTYTTVPLASTTTYYVTASNGSCETTYRVPVKAVIKTTTNIVITPSSPIVCGDTDVISIMAAGDTTEEDLIVQNFESGLGSWTIATPTNTNAGADTPWSVKTSPYQSTTTVVWKPAVNSGAIGSIGNKFAFTTSDYSSSNIVTTMTSPIINPATLPSYTSLTLTFDHYYSYFSGDSGRVEVSINGGAFTAVTPTPALYNSDLGAASTFVGQTVNLNAYAVPTTTSLQFRFVYTASFDDGWALDNIRLYGVRPLNTTFTWGPGANAYTDALATIPYTNQSVTTIYVKPDAAQINNASWAFTATATLANGCSVVKNINVTNNSKIWTGTNSQLWNDAGNWVPNGIPDATNCVVLPSNTQITGSGFNALAKTLTVKSTGNLELQSSNTLTVTDAVTVVSPGVFNIRNNASLIQINPVANTGNINMQRTAFIDFRDYVYWSTPVSPFHASNISLTSNNTSLYKWIPTIVGNGAGNFGNWTSGNETMVAGLGYIERGLNTAPLNAPVNFTSTLTGVPNNGNISVGISRGTYNTVGTYPSPSSPTNATQDDDNWNLLGNPYPSAISARDFLIANAANLDGFVKIWRHGIAPSSLASDPFYNNYVYNYDSSDYLTYNLSGPSSQSGFDGYIGAGQGFITRMLPTSPTASSTAVFNNTMRSNTYRNDQFYKSAAAAHRTNENTEGRIWIDLVSSNANITTLIAYVNGATNQKDQMYDAMTDIKSTFNIYSLLEGYDRHTIQGRSLPFNQDDQVPLGIKIAANGNYTIAIQGLDGFFAETNQAVYLEDKLLNVIHDLRAVPYSFTSAPGEYLDRFVVRYSQAALSNNDFDYTNSVKIFAGNRINIISAIEPIKEIKVYDLLGKLLTNKTNVSKNEFVLNELNPTLSTLIVKVTLENNTVITKKVIF